MSRHHALAFVALGLACTRPSTPSTTSGKSASSTPSGPGASGRGPTVDAGRPLGCEGALVLSVAVYAMPHGGERRLSVGSDGRIEFIETSGGVGGDAVCSEALSPSELRAFAERVAALRLHMLPKRISAPAVRDGVTVVVEGSCGLNPVSTTVRNLFPIAVGKLTDLVNELLSTHCKTAARLPTGAQLAQFAATTGATVMCSQDCAVCNSCSMDASP